VPGHNRIDGNEIVSPLARIDCLHPLIGP